MSGTNSKSNSDDGLWIAFIVLAAFMAIVFLTQKYYWAINAVLGSIAWVHVLPVATLGKIMPFLESVPLLGPFFITPCVNADAFLSEGGFAMMDPGETRRYIMSAAGRVAFIVYAPFYLRMIMSEIVLHVDQIYKKRHTIESMLREQAKSFATIRMFKRLDPASYKEITPQDIAEKAKDQIKKEQPVGELITGHKVMTQPSGYARSMNPEEWLVANGLVMDTAKYDQMISGMFPADSREFYFKEQWDELSIDSIAEALEAQLKSPWRGPENLPAYQQAIYVVMAMFYGYDLKAGNKLLDALGDLAEKAVIEKKTMDEMIRSNPQICGIMKKVLSSIDSRRLDAIVREKHAWVESAFPTILRTARFERGVLATASFIWLKREDRSFWYLLNAVGNAAVNVEACGAMAHNRAELDFDGPLRVPHTYQAARSILHDYLDCRPDRIEKRKKKESEARSFKEQIRLMSNDAKEQHRKS